MKTVTIESPDSLNTLKLTLNQINPESAQLYFENFNLCIVGRKIDYNGHTFIINDVGTEINEIPLLTILRDDVNQLIEDVEWDEERQICLGSSGYYTKNEKSYNRFKNISFSSHTGWSFDPYGMYAWNLPNINNGTLIGFYWVSLTDVIEKIYK